MAIGQAKRKASLATGLSFPQSTRSSTRILGRKRVAVSPAPDAGNPQSPARPLQKQRSTRLQMDGTLSLLESLPQDVLVKVLCKVNHSDLRQLFLVSKSISEATLVARELHFAFATPFPKAAFRDGDGDDQGPDAPKQCRAGETRLEGKNLASIAVNLLDLLSEV